MSINNDTHVVFLSSPFFSLQWDTLQVLGTDLLEEYLDAYDLELELEVEQRLGKLEVPSCHAMSFF